MPKEGSAKKSRNGSSRGSEGHWRHASDADENDVADHDNPLYFSCWSPEQLRHRIEQLESEKRLQNLVGKAKVDREDRLLFNGMDDQWRYFGSEWYQKMLDACKEANVPPSKVVTELGQCFTGPAARWYTDVKQALPKFDPNRPHALPYSDINAIFRQLFFDQWVGQHYERTSLLTLLNMRCDDLVNVKEYAATFKNVLANISTSSAKIYDMSSSVAGTIFLNGLSSGIKVKLSSEIVFREKNDLESIIWAALTVSSVVHGQSSSLSGSIIQAASTISSANTVNYGQPSLMPRFGAFSLAPNYSTATSVGQIPDYVPQLWQAENEGLEFAYHNGRQFQHNGTGPGSHARPPDRQKLRNTQLKMRTLGLLKREL